MNEIPLKQIIDSSLENIKNVLDTNSIIGEPIKVGEKTVVIPIAKVSVGITSGGVDYDAKKTGQPHFGGGNGAGVTMTPVSFLVINGDDVRMLNVNDPKANNDVSNIIGSVSDLVDRAPEVISRLKKSFSSDKPDKNDEKSKDEADDTGAEPIVGK